MVLGWERIWYGTRMVREIDWSQNDGPQRWQQPQEQVGNGRDSTQSVARVKRSRE